MAVTLYSARLIGPEVIEAGADAVVTCPVYRDGVLAAPSAGTLTVWNAANVSVATPSVTIVSNVATATVTAASLSGQTNGDGWRMEWALVIAGVTHTFRRDASRVYRRLYPVVTDADLLRLHTDLTRRLPSTETSYQDYLDETWAAIESRLIMSGKRPWLIMAPSATRDIHLYGTLARIFRDLAPGGPGTAEWELAAEYDRKYEAAWTQMTYPQAEPVSGLAADAARRRASQPTLWLSAKS
jgi:hypothetical protein